MLVEVEIVRRVANNLEGGLQLPILRSPETNNAVVVGHRNKPPKRVECDRVDHVPLIDIGQFVSAKYVPNVSDSITRSGRDGTPVRQKAGTFNSPFACSSS